MNKFLFLLICCPSLVFATIVGRFKELCQKNKVAVGIILTSIPCILSYPTFIGLRNLHHVMHIHRVLHKHDIRFAKEDGNYDKMIHFSVVAKQKGIAGLRQTLKEKGRIESFRYMCNQSGSFSDALAEIGGMSEEDIYQLRHLVEFTKKDD